MNRTPFEKQIDTLELELKHLDEFHSGRLTQMRIELDRLKLEVIALKKFVKDLSPESGEKFEKILEETLHSVDPEFHAE